MSPADQPTHRKVFADNVREAREKAGLTQEGLGWAAGLHQTEIARIERGIRNPGLDTVVKLARGLNIEAATLVRNIP